ncbi:MAG: metallophosphoesterase [Lachnospiraceae bacterium]|nr:metallophosphoesterase [Lachnospiraceae bacterium]
MWLIIFAAAILAGIAALLYMAGKIRKSGIFAKAGKTAERIMSVAGALAAVVALIVIFDVTNAIVIVIHLAVFMLITDLLAFIYRRISKKEFNGRYADIAALSFGVIYLIIGWWLMHGLWETDYDLGTDKQIGHVRVAHIADSHIGCGFSGKGFGKRLDRIEEAEPDVLVITGDFVDDSTSKADMIDACAALGNFKSKYGVFFCFGNHDRGYSKSARGYDGDDLIAELTKNGVTVLEDESVLVDGRFYITGRRDSGYMGSDRLDISELVADLDKDKYDIVLDHQPTDYDAEAAADVDLVLSGHTHGGQLFPLEYIQPLVSSNDRVRGMEVRNGTVFIVTDGISDWAVKFKTGCRSEFNIIDIYQERK